MPDVFNRLTECAEEAAAVVAEIPEGATLRFGIEV